METYSTFQADNYNPKDQLEMDHMGSVPSANNGNDRSPTIQTRSPSPTVAKPSPVGILRSAPPIEVDYDANPSRLYKFIEAKNWREAVLRCQTNPEEAQTWVMRKEKDGKVRWKLLPLHAALILKSPGEVVDSLLRAYPHGAQCKDDQGMLPIHLGFQKEASEDAIHCLLRVFPEGVKVKDKRGKIAVERLRAPTQPNSVLSAYAHACVQAERSYIIEEQEKIYDVKFRTIHERHEMELESLRRSMQNEIEDLQQVRHEALNSARELSLYDLSSTHNVIGVLKDEIERLKQTVGELTKVNLVYKSAVDDMRAKRDDLSNAFVRMAFEQDAIVKAAQQQKDGMDAALMVREKMMQAINQQETESKLKADMERNAIIDLAQQQKKVIHNVIARNAGGVIPEDMMADERSMASLMSNGTSTSVHI